MAAEPSDPDAHAFVLAVMAKLKVTTARELFRRLGYTNPDMEKTVGRWVSGVNRPNFHATIRLLEAAGWLKREGLEAAGRPVRRAATQKESEAALRRAESEEPHPNERAGPRRG